MTSSPVILTRDPALANRTLTWLATDFSVAATIAEDTETASQLLMRSPCATVFLDTRAGEFASEAATFLRGVIDGELAALNLVTIGSNAYPIELVGVVDLLTQLHLNHENCWNDEDVQNRLREILNTPHARPVPRRFTVDAGSVAISTYTPSLFPVLENVSRVSQHNVTLLIVGATGTGKTTLAKFIHMLSPRRDRPFQTLACGALPGDLIESELFGHSRGAFTGADRNKIGRFQAAGTGTLLLDEIDVLDPKQQAKLLRVIETGEYEMVGSTETKHSDARLIVASNVNLESLTQNSQFRADLYYRLNVLEFPLPCLKDRPLDIIPMVQAFVTEFCEQHDIVINTIHEDFIDAVKRYPWPGNIRELKNHIRRAVLLCETDMLTVNDLSPVIIRAQFAEPECETPTGARKPNGWSLSDRVAQSEREMLIEALRAHNDNRTATAKSLGLSRVGLYKKLRRFGLVKKSATSAK
ncbi:sigma 54-interacting transcriptional regulator [Thalassoroseus pseudoceratinae]|uniref:sigma 54-interacting transcriptional regulator n=1 Tax=Thalassoroseus pseudoceratinae TaxID=2713176 RepID=UPI00141EC243|nr:sigma-54 dependent transcriptional regulator [Thalassoroseus pseudoceratinae]